MINKCKVQIRMKELYNVVESLKEGDEKMYYRYPENIIFCETSILVVCFCNDVVHASDRLSSLRLSSLTHPLQRSIVCCTLGQGLISRIRTRKIVQLQYSLSHQIIKVMETTTHPWCSDHSTSISSCGVWWAMAEI